MLVTAQAVVGLGWLADMCLCNCWELLDGSNCWELPMAEGKTWLAVDRIYRHVFYSIVIGRIVQVSHKQLYFERKPSECFCMCLSEAK